jgi:RNA polymerase-binding transcription factor
MDTKHFKQRLLEKEQELTQAIARAQSEARVSHEGEVEDVMDQATSEEARSERFEESTLEWMELTQVRDALRRIENGTYGKCVDCGRAIEPARLEAIPWTPYCLADQEKHDRASVTPSGSSL